MGRNVWWLTSAGQPPTTRSPHAAPARERPPTRGVPPPGRDHFARPCGGLYPIRGQNAIMSLHVVSDWVKWEESTYGERACYGLGTC